MASTAAVSQREPQPRGSFGADPVEAADGLGETELDAQPSRAASEDRNDVIEGDVTKSAGVSYLAINFV
ncbi:hypothetical protein [Amycolatopsis vastitatis]|uniref:Uncharacterized protein n=1 Tax=Amycolatopsis vastitatis TaxID=1905142 RepID=A0A229TC67_9PSEU|nr:hypothetical protein [Amycolatopsis vastitatis]OXM68521.1 hypothetical protein CF165_13540 [Amycolatopsis vastitatis]